MIAAQVQKRIDRNASFAESDSPLEKTMIARGEFVAPPEVKEESGQIASSEGEQNLPSAEPLSPVETMQ
jgi:hypothetical protein